MSENVREPPPWVRWAGGGGLMVPILLSKYLTFLNIKPILCRTILVKEKHDERQIMACFISSSTYGGFNIGALR